MPSTIEQNDDVNSASEPPQKKAKTLFSFVPERELSIVLPQSQSKNQTGDYLQAPCVSIDTNLATFGGRMKENIPCLLKLLKKFLKFQHLLLQ